VIVQDPINTETIMPTDVRKFFSRPIPLPPGLFAGCRRAFLYFSLVAIGVLAVRLFWVRVEMMYWWHNAHVEAWWFLAFFLAHVACRVGYRDERLKAITKLALKLTIGAMALIVAAGVMLAGVR